MAFDETGRQIEEGEEMNRREFLEKMRDGLTRLTVAVTAGGVVGKALGVLNPDDVHAEASIPPKEATTKPYFESALYINPAGKVRVGSGGFMNVAFTDKDVAIILGGSETDIQAMLLTKRELADYYDQIAALEPRTAKVAEEDPTAGLMDDLLGEIDAEMRDLDERNEAARSQSAAAREKSAAAREDARESIEEFKTAVRNARD